ncbi:unnamed protein product [Cylicocyclus nassatus]|uniref:SCP domain-containing protein n=1 Tax=Cylicocyclus nassatus TaxID=53992 RepID=A0AA36GNM5_CYLNA|nr:unnamed protein product [Cylicocyclus nassatus]
MRSLITCVFVLFNQLALSLQDCGSSALEDKIVQLHNEVRQGVAQREYGEIKYSKVGSKNMFALSYDCSLQGLASASITSCKCDKSFADTFGYSIVCEKAIISGTKAAQIQDAYETTIEGWRDDAKDDIPLPLSAATYTSNVPENFANMIYYKSLRVGCSHEICGKRALIACVYNKKPQSGQPLYIEASTKTGCTRKKCQELEPDSKCDSSNGLCVTDKDSIEDVTTTSTAAVTTSTSTESQGSTPISSQGSSLSTSVQTSLLPTTGQTTPNQTRPSQTTASQTTPPRQSSLGQTTLGQSTPGQTTSRQTTPRQTTTSSSTGCMTDAIRDQVVNAINEKRSSLAKGQVQNGPTGTTLPKATNMYKMSYDTALENEAQTYTNTCPPGKSDLSTRVGHGETTTILDDKSASCTDALKNAIDVWWNEITGKALNKAVKYTQVLEQSANAPTNFTQMAWAASYKVGCGVNHCNYGTIVVCRYYVRGNIYSQYIYRIGSTCGHCSSSCSNGLCKAPN